MRKAYIYSAIIAIVFSSCAKQQSVSTDAFDSQIVPPGKHIETVFAGPMTKTTYTGANETEFHWQAGDKISVLFNNAGVAQFYEFEAISSNDSWETATFKGFVDDGATVGAPTTGTKWALYPANSGHTYTSDTEIAFNMPAGGDGNTAKIPMIAKGTGDSYLFHHLCGAMKFTYTGLKANKINAYFRCGSSYRISGKFKIQALDEEITHAYIVNDQFVDDGSQSNETYVYADVSGAGTAVAYLPLPMSSSMDRSSEKEHFLSNYWAYFYFKVEDADRTGFYNLPEYAVSSGSVSIYKGKITPIASKSLASSSSIDGYFDEWKSKSNLETSDDGKLLALKAYSDGTKLYVYQKWDNSTCNYANWQSYQYLYIDTDSSTSTGSQSSSLYKKGGDYCWKFHFYYNGGYLCDSYRPWTGSDFVSTGVDSGNQEFKSYLSADCYEVEYSVPLADVGITAGQNIRIGVQGYTYNKSNVSQEFKSSNMFAVEIPTP